MSFTQISVDIDEADAVVLQENLTKTRQLISQISQSLNKISKNTANTSNYLNPIVEKNRNLAILKKNIDDSILQVSNIQGIASEANLYESKLIEKIDNVKQYITNIHKSDDILEKLNESSDGIEYKGIQDNLSKTLNQSILRLQAYLFDQLLKTVSTSFDPQVFINNRKAFPYIEDKYLKDSVLIIQFFQESELNKSNESIEQKYVENRVKLIRDSLAFIEPFVKVSRSKNGANIPYEKGSNGINNYTEALVGFIYNEYALLEDLFKDKQLEIQIFKEIFKGILDKYHILCSNILKSIQSTSSTSNIEGLLIFELIDNITKVSQSISSKTQESSLPQLAQSLEECQQTSKSLFQNLLKYTETKVQHLTSLPSDNGICEVTVETMSKLRKFAEYKDSLLKILSNGQIKAGSWIPTSPKPQWLSVFSSVSQTNAVDDNNPLELLSSFFSDVIDALIVSLEIKANQGGLIKKKQSLGYFLITNIVLIEQIISRSELATVLKGNGITRLDKLKKRALNYFLTGWKTAAAYLLDVNIQGKLTSKDKDAIKDKFRNFNSEFDDLVKSYKQYNITDPNLKKFLSKEISFISPLYHRFYDKHSTSDFTKHADRYLKYNKTEFDRILESLGR